MQLPLCIISLLLLPLVLAVDWSEFQDDTTSSLPQSSWWVASDNLPALHEYIQNNLLNVVRVYHLLDLFSCSGNMAKSWAKGNYKAVGYDIKTLGRRGDISSERGYLTLLRMAFKLVEFAAIVAGPPCSLLIFLSSSVHKRHSALHGPTGDESVPKVKLSNVISRNMATLFDLLHHYGRQVKIVVEQPASSWLFKTNWMLSTIALTSMVRIHLWQGHYGHDMLKSTHLMTNIPSMSKLSKKMTKKDSDSIRARFAKKQANLKRKKVYLVHTASGVQGGRDLPTAAYYPRQLCDKVYKIWQEEFEELSEK